MDLVPGILKAMGVQGPCWDVALVNITRTLAALHWMDMANAGYFMDAVFICLMHRAGAMLG